MLYRIQTPSGVDLRESAQPAVVYVTDIDEEHTQKFGADVSRAHDTGQTFIPVIVDSYGGDAYALFGMLAVLEAATLPIVTIVESKAMSCGLSIFAAGAVRIAAPSATLLLHDVLDTTDSERKTSEIKADAEQMARLQAMFLRRLDTAAGKKPGYFDKLLDDNKHVDVFMSAQEAKKHGLVTHIGSPRLTTAITVASALTVDGRAIRTVQ